MSEILRAHALENIWCEPVQDRQYLIKPARLSKKGGAYKQITVLWNTVKLPNANNPLDKGLYHVYQIGQLPPFLFNFNLPKDTWVDFDTLSHDNNLVIDSIVANGTRIPRFYCFARLTSDKNLLLAVRVVSSLDLGVETYIEPLNNLPTTRNVNLDHNALYLRVYSNARYDSQEFLSGVGVHSKGLVSVEKLIKNESDFFSFKDDVQLVRDYFGIVGKGIFTLGGFISSEPTTWNTNYVNKHLGFYWDETVKEVTMLPLTELPTFNSLLDIGKVKYLFFREVDYDVIDYHDDIDVYLVSGTASNFKGVYLLRLYENAVRQVTHNAYAVRKDLVDDLKSKHSFLSGSSSLSLMFVVREGGMKRGLVNQHVRIEEMYKLNRLQRLVVLAGIPEVPEWSAANLENSAYCKIMRLNSDELEQSILDAAYGYNAASRVAAPPVHSVLTTGSVTYAQAPPIAWEIDKTTGVGRRTVFAYTPAGMFLGWHNDQGLYPEIPLPGTLSGAVLTETFNALTTTTGEGFYYETNLVSHALEQFGFRCYACPIVGGIPNEEWVDITGSEYYVYDPIGDVGNSFTPNIQWNTFLEDFANLHTCVKVDGWIHQHAVSLPDISVDGYIKFDVLSTVDWLGDTNLVTKPQTIPPGCIDVFMDGLSLIQGLDYYVNWPTIVIVKRPTTEPVDTIVEVRSYGFCNPETMTNYGPREKGFVKGGILSVNKTYDIRNDRNTRIHLAGVMKDRGQVKFAENASGVLTTDGRPYALTDYLVSSNSFTLRNSVEYHQESLLLDNRISEYLSDKIPEDTVRYPFIIDDKWDVVSPFASAIIHAFQTGFLNSGELDNPYTDAEIDTWVSGFKHLLAFDPCVLEEVEDDHCDNMQYHSYVKIYPHPYIELMQLTELQYTFMERIVLLYLNNRVDLTPSVIIG